eukprot:scaffold825_cov249-Pinguiococcus_pyrenoidosus.AAC.45
MCLVRAKPLVRLIHRSTTIGSAPLHLQTLREILKVLREIVVDVRNPVVHQASYVHAFLRLEKFRGIDACLGHLEVLEALMLRGVLHDSSNASVCISEKHDGWCEDGERRQKSHLLSQLAGGTERSGRAVVVVAVQVDRVLLHRCHERFKQAKLVSPRGVVAFGIQGLCGGQQVASVCEKLGSQQWRQRVQSSVGSKTSKHLRCASHALNVKATTEDILDEVLEFDPDIGPHACLLRRRSDKFGVQRLCLPKAVLGDGVRFSDPVPLRRAKTSCRSFGSNRFPVEPRHQNGVYAEPGQDSLHAVYASRRFVKLTAAQSCNGRVLEGRSMTLAGSSDSRLRVADLVGLVLAARVLVQFSSPAVERQGGIVGVAGQGVLDLASRLVAKNLLLPSRHRLVFPASRGLRLGAGGFRRLEIALVRVAPGGRREAFDFELDDGFVGLAHLIFGAVALEDRSGVPKLAQALVERPGGACGLEDLIAVREGEAFGDGAFELPEEPRL